MQAQVSLFSPPIGGFALSRPPEKIKLKEIVAPFEDLRKCEECILGQPVCSDAGACTIDNFWADVRTRYLEELNTRTLKDLSEFQLKHLAGMSAALRNKVGAVPGMEVFKESRK
jgi:DNA-binding IscR family transcriptional regulator